MSFDNKGDFASMDRIAMIVFNYYPLDPRVRREAEALIEVGKSVDVICLANENESRKEQVNDVNVHRIKMDKKSTSKLRYAWLYFYFIIASFFKLSFLHAKKHYKVIHVHNVPNILVFSALIPRLTGAKIILDMHEIMPEFFMRKFGVAGDHKLIRLLKFFERIAAKFADQVITASPFFSEKVKQRTCAPEKCATILNLPDAKYFNNIVVKGSPNNSKFKIVYPGTLSEIHGVDIALKAVNIVAKDTDIPIEFYIYGSGEEKYRNQLIALAKELQLDGRVFFYNEIPIEKLYEIFQSMDAGVVPKRGGTFAEDAMSTKLFEFAAIGLPVIVSKTKSDALFFDESMVMFFEPGDEKALANCLMKLYQQPDLRYTLSQSAKALFQKKNWDTEKKNLYAVYHKIGLEI